MPDRDVFYACHAEVSTKVGRFPQKLRSLDRDVFYACHDVALAKAGRSSHSLGSSFKPLTFCSLWR